MRVNPAGGAAAALAASSNAKPGADHHGDAFIPDK
jgi:hypothetical protein